MIKIIINDRHKAKDVLVRIKRLFRNVKHGGNSIKFDSKITKNQIKLKNINAPGKDRINPLTKNNQELIVDMILMHMNAYMPRLQANVRVE
jgi:hypothetical protein